MRIILDTLNEQGRSQRWLARRLGVKSEALNRYLHGNRAAPAGLLRRACEELGIPASVIQHVTDFPSGNSNEERAA